MTETEFTRALRETVATGAPPLALDAAGMLDRARHARRRHRAGLAVGTSALTAAGVAAAVLLMPAVRGSSQSVGSAGPGGLNAPAGCSAEGQASAPGSGPDSAVPTTTHAPPAAADPACPGGSDTQSPWPSGQSDRTAHSGVHAVRAQQLLAALVDSLPAGYRSSAPWQQGQFDHLDGRTEVWEYAANIQATKAGRTGVLLAVVSSATPASSTNLCKLAEYFSGPPATGCHVLTVGGKQVAIARHPTEQRALGYSPDLDQWAVYRYPDGTVVRIAQAKSADADSHGKALKAPLFTETQLATLATRPQFH